MASSISLMFGRLGGVTGANITALLLGHSCEIAFYLSGSILIGKWFFFIILPFNFSQSLCHFVAMSVLVSFIPNIQKRTVKSDEDQTKADPRLSRSSFWGSVKSFWDKEFQFVAGVENYLVCVYSFVSEIYALRLLCKKLISFFFCKYTVNLIKLWPEKMWCFILWQLLCICVHDSKPNRRCLFVLGWTHLSLNLVYTLLSRYKN